MAMTRPDAKARGEENSIPPAQAADRRAAAWRDLFTFRAAAQPRPELWLSIGAFLLVLAVACLAGLAMPIVLPVVVLAVLWHLHRRSVSATWLMT